MTPSGQSYMVHGRSVDSVERTRCGLYLRVSEVPVVDGDLEEHSRPCRNCLRSQRAEYRGSVLERQR